MCLPSRSPVETCHRSPSKYAQVSRYNASSYTGRLHRPVSRSFGARGEHAIRLRRTICRLASPRFFHWSLEVLGMDLQQRLPLLCGVAPHVDHPAGIGQVSVLRGENGGGRNDTKVARARADRAILAWLARKRPTLGHHFPAIHRDSAQTKGTMLLSIVSSS